MLTKTHTELWSDFLAYMEERCSAAEFQNWIAPIKVVEETSSDLVFKFPIFSYKNTLFKIIKKICSGLFP